MGMISAKSVDLQTAVGTQVSTRVLSWKSSKTIIFNAILFFGATFIQLVDLLTGANLVAPIIGLFVKDVDSATRIATTLTQAYSAVSFYLRLKTNAPVTLK